MAEIEAAIKEEREARAGLGLREAFFGKGNWPRFLIAFVIFLLQQWAGQNSVKSVLPSVPPDSYTISSYYTPTIFASIGYVGTQNGLLATGIYGTCPVHPFSPPNLPTNPSLPQGVMKLASTIAFIAIGIETLGRKKSLFISAMGMGTFFFIVGAILKTHPPPATSLNAPPPTLSPASRAMAAMIYIYVCFYSMGWGPVPWVYVADIFPTRTRHYGLAFASASQWLWSKCCRSWFGSLMACVRLCIIKGDPTDGDQFGVQAFFDVCDGECGCYGGVFFVRSFRFCNANDLCVRLIPETMGRSLEEMDIIFGAVTAEERQKYIEAEAKGTSCPPI